VGLAGNETGGVDNCFGFFWADSSEITTKPKVDNLKSHVAPNCDLLHQRTAELTVEKIYQETVFSFVLRNTYAPNNGSSLVMDIAAGDGSPAVNSTALLVILSCHAFPLRHCAI